MTSFDAHLGRAIDAWTQLLGTAHVATSAEALEVAMTATFATTAGVAAILYPGDRNEVQACMRIAHREGVSVYPVSSGRNWGYGSGAPVRGGGVVLDLKRMNRIVDFDEEMAYVTVEPGVTQRQLLEFIEREAKGRLWIDPTSASPLSSLIGNIMERGHGITPYGDHTEKACGYEVVLADGECIQTGFAAFPGAASAPLDRWGLGPSLDGLFSQSNLGVVTKMTLWLCPAAEHVEVAFFGIDDDQRYGALADAMRPLRLAGQLRCGPHSANVYQSLLRVTKYPWDRTGGATPLMPELALQLAREYGISAWNGVIPLYGDRATVAAARAAVERALEGVTSRLVFRDEAAMTLDSGVPDPSMNDARKVFGQLTGKLSAVGLARAYWRMDHTPSEHVDEIDLDADRCGCAFMGASSPYRGADVRRLLEIATHSILGHGFEPSIGALPVRERTMQFHISICYDRSVEGDDARVLAAVRDTTKRLCDAGYYPHRLGIPTMGVMDLSDPGYRKVLATLKTALDPKSILAPGRYEPASGERG